MVKESIIQKIQKLTAKAESSREIGNVEEAAMFSAKVTELLTKHNLEISDIDVEDNEDVTGDRADDLGLSIKQGKWTIHLLSIIGEYNYCEIIYHTSRKYNGRGRVVKEAKASATIIGRPDNVEVTKYLYSVLKRQFEQMSKGYWNTYIKSIKKRVSEMTGIPAAKIKNPAKYVSGVTTRQSFYKSFYLGAVKGVKDKLEAQFKEAEQTYGAKITDLMIVNDGDIKSYMSEHFPDVKQMSSRRTKIDGSAYRQGVEAGKSSSFAKGVASGATVATKMLK
jgi:hypothetical protein